MALNSGELSLANEIGFDPRICEVVKGHTRASLERLTAVDYEENRSAVNGLSVRVDGEDVRQIVDDLEAKLSPSGYHAFASEVQTDSAAVAEIAVLKTDDPFELIQIRGTSGINYGVTTDRLIDTLREWDERCDFRVVGAGHDWVEIAFSSLPDDICLFAEQVYQLCPDSVDQGTALMNESDDPEMFSAARRLCPNLSAEMETALDAQQSQFDELDIPPELKALVDTMGTPTDMGIRLLAYQLKDTRILSLWWD